MPIELAYRTRNPEENPLYRVIAGHLETFLTRQRERDRSVPEFVEREFRAFIECGVLCRGFLRVHCDACGLDRVVPYSCKRRGFCNSCCNRRMADTAAHLVDRVFPRVPVRQWVLTFPYDLRYRLAYDAALVTQIFQIFTKIVFASLMRRAREFGAVRNAQCGAVSFIQRFDSALRLNLHIHSLVIDGIYAAGDDDQPHFQVLPAPGDEEIAQLTRLVGLGIRKFLERRGLGANSDPGESDPLVHDQPWLAELYAASVVGRSAYGGNAGEPIVRRGDQIDPETIQAFSSPRCATIDGFSLHANVAVHAGDRARLERLARYCARPPVAVERLEQLDGGRLLYRFKRAWRNGTTHVVLEPLQMLEKLAALIPAPYAHLVRYAGVLAPAAKWRPLIVPPTPPEVECAVDRRVSETTIHADECSAAAAGYETSTLQSCALPHDRNYTWAELMKRVWALDVLECPRCRGRMRIVAAIHSPDVIHKILECLGLPSRAPPISVVLPKSVATIQRA